MNKKLVCLLSAILLLFIFQPQLKAFAVNQTDEYYLVETANPQTFLRQGADDQYNVKAVIPINEKLVAMSEFVNSKSEYWLQVKYNGAIGWIKKNGLKSLEIKNQFLISSSAATPIKDQTKQKQTGIIEKGQIVIPTDVFTESNGERWIQVTVGKVTGWAQLTNLELFNGGKNYLNKQLFIKNDTLVRRGASVNENGVYSIKKGTLVTIQSFLNGNGTTWYHIKDGEKSGWIPAGAAANQVSLSIYLYAAQGTPVLRGAGSNYPAVSTLSIGQRVQTASKFISSDNKIWYRVVLESGKSGWVMGTSLTSKRIKIVYLTIDDGPSSYTSRLLDILNKYHAKATFFMLNGNMKAHPNEVKRMIKEGHAVGSHGVTHDKNKFYRSPSSAVNEMMTARSTLIKITGKSSNLIRVPYGSVPFMKQSYRAAASKQHFIMWDWNVDSLDWKFNSSKYVGYSLSQVRRLEKNGTVPVILIHDRKATVNSLPLLLSTMEKQGYVFAPLNESMKPYQFHTSR